MTAYKKFCMFCHTEIEMSDRSGKWLPYNVTTGTYHDCPERGDSR